MKGFKNIGHLMQNNETGRSYRKTNSKKKKKIKCKKDLNVKDLKPKKIEVNRAIKPLDIDLSIFFFFGRDGEI